MVYLLVIIITILNTVYGGYPISDPNAKTVDGKQEPYNLIDTDPSCFYVGICPMFTPGHKLSVFPNSEEKFQQMLHNLHRMFANQSLDTPLGHWFYGWNEEGGETFFCKQGCAYCGTTNPNRKPLYWYSDANQMARFNQWDQNTCNQSWYNQPGENHHSTCGWANTSLPAWKGFINGVFSQTYNGVTYKTGTDRCTLFGATPNPSSSPTNPTPFNADCGFSARGGKFCHDTKDRCWFETEGMCAGNTCLFDPNCEPIFANKYDYVGKGFVANMDSVSSVYSRYTKEIYYPLPVGVHYDQRWRMVEQDRDTATGKYFVLMLEYFDYNKTQTPSKCYALYNGGYSDMSVYVSNHPYDGGSYKPGSYDNNDFSVIFKSNYFPPTSCEPYSFICKTSLGRFFRLPEEQKYYFGTEWIDWIWSDFQADYGYSCEENHYFKHDTEGWTVNGGPKLTKSDIWYYQQSNSCQGCSKISILDCWEGCILSNFQSSQCQCGGGSTTNAPTSKSPTTKFPTTSPVTKSPTTPAPTETTESPTAVSLTTPAPTETSESPTNAFSTTPAPSNPKTSTIQSSTTEFVTTEFLPTESFVTDIDIMSTIIDYVNGPETHSGDNTVIYISFTVGALLLMICLCIIIGCWCMKNRNIEKIQEINIPLFRLK